MSKLFVGVGLFFCVLGSALVLTAAARTTTTSIPGGGATVPLGGVFCVRSAIDKRDNAIISAANTFHALVTSALQTRINALKSAWANTDEKARKTALKTAWSAYRDATKKARRDLQSARKAAWKQYETDRKACGAGAVKEPGGGQGADASL
ncbi:MAG: hypothetical protein HY378_01395 [Candidatus Brennerbacteria bacterium]|nr:hypothetical protein [Candidatus Brennerbacteria bacterium]